MINIPNSSRLRFSLISQDDKALLFELDQDPEVMKYINGGKTTTWEDIEQRLIPRLNAYRNPEKGWGIWAVHTLDEDKFLGWVLVRPLYFFDDSTPTELNNLELGWRFKRETWGKGYGTEAAQAVADIVSQRPEINKISAIAEKANIGSTRIMEKLGMSYIKELIYRDPLGDMTAVYYEKIVK